MQVSYPNNVKIYNLSAGKSLPEWLSERKRRSLSKKNVDIRRRIELIQDFDMPGLSTSIKVSKDGQYILVTGIYKPRVKCFDVNNLSLKFERCFDSEVITFQTLSDDYSKLVFLHCDRNIEFHAAHGKYYKLRIPRFGRDMQYHYPSCDLYVVGDSNEIYRINLERGQFLQSFSTDASSLNKCQVNPEHHLLVVGTQEGRVEAWDPRVKTKVGTLDCALHCVSGEKEKLDAIPAVTALKFHGGLTLGVGTTTGNVLLYDVRSSKPMLVKDHMYGLPVKNIEFHNKMNMVYSMDSSVVKIWSRDNGKPYTSIEASRYADYNDLCVVPDTGMLFAATENVKIQTYYIPSLGPAPHWCSFLDNLTEELEELNYETVYDDYKFITEKELDELGLAHLKGTNLLRAYMHGYFMDIRLYRKARDAIKPFEFDEYKKNRIREKIQEDRGSRVQVQKLPPVNKELALKLMDEESKASSKKKQATTNLLQDKRFKDLFTNPDFQVDKTSEEYTLLNPVVSHLGKSKARILKAQTVDDAGDVVDENEGYESSGDERLLRDTSSSDDEKPWVTEVRKRYRHIRRRNETDSANEGEDASDANEQQIAPRLYEIKEDTNFRGARPVIAKCDRTTLGERLQKEGPHVTAATGTRGNKEMTFTTGKQKRNHQAGSQHTRKDRRHVGHLLRPTRSMRKTKR